MAELVEFNLEQSLEFFNVLKNHIDEDEFKDLIRKRKHHEYKIASLNREFSSFKRFIKHELDVLVKLKNLQIPDGRLLINKQKKLLQRLVKQVLTHFKHDPKAFLYSTRVYELLQSTQLELSCWEQLISLHGSKNVNYYIEAVKRGVISIQAEHKYNVRNLSSKLTEIDNKLKSGIYLNSAQKMSKLESEKSNLLSQNGKSLKEIYISHMHWTREIFMDGFNEFPANKILLIGYLIFEIDNQEFFIENSPGEEQEESSSANGINEVKNGDFIDSILNNIIDIYRNDWKYLKEILDIVRSKSSRFQSAEIVEKIKQLIETGSQLDADADEEMPETAEEPIAITNEQFFREFNAKFPDLKFVRVKNPLEISSDFHRYLEIVMEKFLSNQMDKVKDYPIIKSAIESILMDFDWEPIALDLYWDYYRLEKYCNGPMKCLPILQRAQQKLQPDLHNKFKMRLLKEEVQKRNSRKC